MVRTRFAPSPTGYLHIGGVRTALFNWLFARQNGGQFILRIDDTDEQRNVAEALQPILAGFRWLGIDWDEGPEVGGPHGPYFQSQRGDHYQAAVDKLLEGGFAYRDYSANDYAVERQAAQDAKQPFVYSRKWMAENDAAAAAFEAEGRTATIRLKMPREGTCVFRDLIRDEMRFDWAQEPDHVIQRSNGQCVYHLATVVDDHDLQITHVIRAVEHLSNTPRQIFIAQSLGYDCPQFAHLPYVAEPGSQNKLSKRHIEKYLKNPEFKKLYDAAAAIAGRIGVSSEPAHFNPVLVDFYRAVGFLPEAVVNYLLLLGWSWDDKTEDFSREEMIEKFTFAKVNKAPASFDPAKLISFQARYMQRLDAKKKPALCLPFLQRAGLVSEPPACELGPQLIKIIDGAGDRIRMAGEILDFDDFFVDTEQIVYDEKAFKKRVLKEGAVDLLQSFRGKLANTEDFTESSLHALMQDFLEQEAIKMGQIIHAVRVAVTGKAVGFGMFETLEVLGKDRCLQRIDRTLQKAAEGMGG
ncbi:MAG: glutamate--tRNA ligase [Pirellulaceae bacterium]|jgi:glutamyl-tRNA synthetase|nr:glutamate--tRNA ligase [Planctomycetaceae bacterium]